ncbi:transposase [Sorangium sp. So ce1182]|uniref:transposase n=1 Tax=Sorangium sp. So ce1182 TaxID=3133334 RepID=UPI003F643960
MRCAAARSAAYPVQVGARHLALANPAAFAALLDALYRKPWAVHAEPPFAGPEPVFAYLGRSTHRVGLSNHRMRSMDERGVCFRPRGDKTVTLSAEELVCGTAPGHRRHRCSGAVPQTPSR